MWIGSLSAAAKVGHVMLLIQATPEICVGVGDVIQVSIFETVAAGIRSGNFLTLPSQTVTASGMFTLPFAGDIKAAGRPIPEIRREIEARLAKRAIEPAVEVTLIKRNSPGQCLP
jgi:polysaccharide export outer membrane protein